MRINYIYHLTKAVLYARVCDAECNSYRLKQLVPFVTVALLKEGKKTYRRLTNQTQRSLLLQKMFTTAVFNHV